MISKRNTGIIWPTGINWGRLAIVFTILPAILCFMGMVWAFVDHDAQAGFIQATCIAVNVTCTVAIWHYTRRR